MCLLLFELLAHGDNDRLVVEVGCRGKGRQQFKDVTIDRKFDFAGTDVPSGGKIPLFLAGFMA
jgi:hypothetical protein